MFKGRFSFGRFLKVLGVSFFPICALLLGLILHQDRVLRSQSQAVDFWMWQAGATIYRQAVVVESGKAGCFIVEFDDAFPLGHRRTFCLSYPPYPEGTRLLVGVAGSQVVSVEEDSK